jgi:hypothetical protein
VVVKMDFNGGFWMMNIEGSGDCGGSFEDDCVDWWFLVLLLLRFVVLISLQFLCLLYFCFSFFFSIFSGLFSFPIQSLFIVAMVVWICLQLCISFQILHQLSNSTVWEICTMLSVFSNCLFSNLISLHQKVMP